jgi:bacillithiol biosynthesis cysteine-adding enzyme BshC
VTEGIKIRRRLELPLVPQTTALFRDFVNDFEKVADFYPLSPRRLLDEMNPELVLKGRDFSRQQLTEILRVQNKRLGCGPQTLANIELLNRPDALVVITGQQVGLFTGPLFTVYKALTVLRLVRQLGERFPFRFLPLFWMASEDHDYQEVNRVVLLDEDNQPNILQLRSDYRQGTPVGDLLLGPEIESLLQRLDQALPESEFKAPVLTLFRAAYRPTVTFSEAFGRAMLALFAEAGLIMADPMDPGLRRLAAPIFRRELESAPQSAELVAQGSGRLEQRGYHAQLQLAPPGVNLFVLMNGRRSAMVRDGRGFRLKRGRKIFSSAELMGLLERSPERFSPNAALRPVVQDRLFPVAAYVAGPAEIAYFAQLSEVYRLFGVPESCIYPRASFTLVEGRVRELVEKFGLTVEEVFVPEDRLMSRVLGQEMPGELEELLESSGRQVREAFQALSDKIMDFEPTMQGYLDASRGKVDHQLKAVRRKMLQAKRARDRTTREQVARVSRQLFPAGQLQERILSIIPFLARHGTQILAGLEPFSGEPWEHQVVEIGR